VAVFPEGEAKYFRQLLKILPYYPTPEDILASDGLKEIRGLRNKCRQGILELAARTVGVHYDSYRWLIRDLSMQRNESLEKCAKFTSALERGIEEHSYGRVLLSFPFLGVIAAATIIGIIADIDRWPNKKKFKKALGVYTNVTQSGTHMSYKRGKEGSREGRRVLFQICLGCIRGNARENDFKDYYLRQVSIR
jgi:transposase